MPDQILRAPILNPRADGTVEFLRDGVIHADFTGRIAFVGEWNDLAACLGPGANVHRARGLILPPMLDNHIHIPQHPIRGDFMKDVEAHPPEGRLLAGLNRNVFPAEAKCADRDYTEQVVRDFLEDTLSKGVVGGAAYMTVHPQAARIALEILPSTWSVGPVLMNMNCPEYLRTDESTWQTDVDSLTRDFGRRVIVTDRFAVSVDSRLRREAVALARRLGLRMQTHLNEQIVEKRLVEQVLYPDAWTYTDVYDRDGLLDCDPILAHCVRMSMGEFQWVSWKPGSCIAHCPTSNTLLGSGIMPLNRLFENGIDYAICTDVGASPTTSILAEMAQYLKIHRGRSSHARPSEALYRSTLAPARMLGLSDLGTFEVGKPLSYIEVACEVSSLDSDSVDDVILSALLNSSSKAIDAFASRETHALTTLESTGLDIGPELQSLSDEVEATRTELEGKVNRVVMNGATVWERS